MDGYFAVVFLLAIIFLFVSLVAPRAFRNIPYLKTFTSRRQLATFFGLVALFSFILFGFTTDPVEVPQEVAALEAEVVAADNTTTPEVSPERMTEVASVDLVEATSDSVSQMAVDDDAMADEFTPVISVPVTEVAASTDTTYYEVDRVVDGDTVDVVIDGKVERLRLIGIDTPETVHPSKPVECYGIEASNKAKELLSGTRVALEVDDSQGDRDKYGRMLRYVFLEDGTNFNELMIAEGYAYEYTYDQAYTYQSLFKNAQRSAEQSGSGLWGDMCQTQWEEVAMAPLTVGASQADSSCEVKGNISSSDEKIYHVPGCDSYNQTRISESKGEQWFCSEQEALDAGWRKALNCN